MDVGRLPLPAAGRGDSLERALAAVGERAEEDLVVGAGSEPAVGERAGDLDGGQRALERVGREQDDHAAGRCEPAPRERLESVPICAVARQH